MLDRIKRSLFKICNQNGEELSVVENENRYEIEFSTIGSLWLFRYDCIVAAEFPQQALTFNEKNSSFELSTFLGSDQQVLKAEPQNEPEHYTLVLHHGFRESKTKNKDCRFVAEIEGKLSIQSQPDEFIFQIESDADNDFHSRPTQRSQSWIVVEQKIMHGSESQVSDYDSQSSTIQSRSTEMPFRLAPNIGKSKVSDSLIDPAQCNVTFFNLIIVIEMEKLTNSDSGDKSDGNKRGISRIIQKLVKQRQSSNDRFQNIQAHFANIKTSVKSFFWQESDVQEQRFENGASMRHDPLNSRITTNSPPLTDSELQSVLEGRKSIFDDFPPWRVYNTLFSESGLDDSVRGLIWCKLLSVDSLKAGSAPNLYQKLISMENDSLVKQIEQDQISSRSNIYEGNKDTEGQQQYVADPQKLKNVIKAYGCLDIELGYCQGYNYIVSLLLRFIDDEEMVFWCMVKIMSSMEWRRFFVESDPSMQELQDKFPELLKEAVPKLHEKLMEDCPALLMSLSFTFPQRYVMSIFSCKQPIKISKHVFDLFFFEQSGEECLLRLLLKMLRHVEQRCFQMEEKELFDFISNGSFVEVCFDEILLEELCRDD